MIDVVGLVKLIVYVASHFRGTYRFLQMTQVMMRVFTKDIHGAITPFHRRDE